MQGSELIYPFGSRFAHLDLRAPDIRQLGNQISPMPWIQARRGTQLLDKQGARAGMEPLDLGELAANTVTTGLWLS